MNQLEGGKITTEEEGLELGNVYVHLQRSLNGPP